MQYQNLIYNPLTNMITTYVNKRNPFTAWAKLRIYLLFDYSSSSLDLPNYLNYFYIWIKFIMFNIHLQKFTITNFHYTSYQTPQLFVHPYFRGINSNLLWIHSDKHIGCWLDIDMLFIGFVCPQLSWGWSMLEFR